MQRTSQNLRTILTTVVVIALGFFAYEYIFSNKDVAEIYTGAGGNTAGITEGTPGWEIFKLYDEVSAINLDGEVFTAPEFERLVDYSVTLPSLNVGRSNPFAPIGRTVSPARR